jgi:anti-anti-sigma factor
VGAESALYGTGEPCYLGSRTVHWARSPRAVRVPSIAGARIRPLFDLVERPLDGQTRLIAPIGDLDAATNPAFSEAVHAATGGRAERIVIDLSEVSFMSAGALGVIARARGRAKRHGAGVVVLCPNQALRRLFVVAGLGAALD